jgi:phthalate 4,5-dioxygenase oxygenase subunit
MPTAEDVSGSTATDEHWLRPSADKSPRLEVERTSYGFRYAAIRTPVQDPDKQDYVRTTLQDLNKSERHERIAQQRYERELKR